MGGQWALLRLEPLPVVPLKALNPAGLEPATSLLWGMSSTAELHYWDKTFNLLRKRQRESDRMAALADLSKLGNLGALAAWALEEGDEDEVEEVEEEELYQTEMEMEKQNAIELR